MEHEKHRTCPKCGELLPEGGYVDEWDCPVCSATFLGPHRTRLLKAVFWGGVTALAFFLIFIFLGGGELHDFTPLSFFALVWVIVTVIILLPGGRFGGFWGDGGGGNGGG